MNEINLDNAELYINRELSLLEFNHRVLELAQDESVPLLERLKYLAISSSNLDEFFEVRFAGLKQQVELGIPSNAPDGLTPQQQIDSSMERANQLVELQYETLNKDLIPSLAEEGIHFVRRTHWNEEQAKWVKNHFNRELLPMLSPIGLDPSHPFPRILNKSLNFIVTLEGKDAFGRDSGMAIVQAPRSLPRLIRMPEEMGEGEYNLVFLSSIIHAHVGDLFPGMTATGCYQFRVTRNTDMYVNEEEIEDLLTALEGELPQRNFGNAVRLEVADNCTEEAAQYLLKEFHLDETALFQVNGPVNLKRLMSVPEIVDRPDLCFPTYRPGLPDSLMRSESNNLFDIIREQDILLHHPYQSFSPVIELMRQAARDPDVLAIKQTLYRTDSNSRLVSLLIEAARAGKEVTVVVELRARFDEEANIEVASQLQDAGAHVLYGVVGHKTHAKMTMIVRREKNKFSRYVHMGTGNYHAGTAKLYTDFGLMTADKIICEDVHKIFQQLTGLGKVSKLKKCLQSPFTLHQTILEKIDREIEHAKAGKPARIMARMNALVEPQIIRALYKASQADVKIHLVVRGVCCLRPGIAGVSDNIHVRSVMGRFLEHPRVFYFENSGETEIYGSSADWMPRNFFRRVETAFPFEHDDIRKRVLQEGIVTYLSDNTQSWVLQKDGNYRRNTPASNQNPRNAQNILLEKLSVLG